MTLRTAGAAILAMGLIGGSQFAVHCAIDAVARSTALESRLFQPEMRPAGPPKPTALAQAAIGSIR